MFKITATYPTPILEDFKRFMNSLRREEVALSPKNRYISKARLWEMNQFMYFKMEDATPKLDQASYPLLHLFYHLALAGKLVVMKPGKGGRFLLKAAERYEEFLNLTMTEQYFYLLETLWIEADWRELQKATYGYMPNERLISSVWQELAHSEAGKTINMKDPASPWQKVWDWGYFLYYFKYFGFWDFTPDKEALAFSRRNIEAKTLTPTEFGVSMAAVLFNYRDYLDWNQVHIRREGLTSQDILDGMEYVFNSIEKKLPQVIVELAKARQDSLGEPFYKRFVPLFAPGELTRTLSGDHPTLMKGVCLIKVSLGRGVWRKIEMAAKHNLHQLHLAIQDAFELDDDHLYSFFMDNKKWSDDCYNSPLDEKGSKANEVRIGELGLYPGKTFLYLFDYGNEWEFTVEVEEINLEKPLPLTPQIVGKRGKAPNQYKY